MAPPRQYEYKALRQREDEQRQPRGAAYSSGAKPSEPASIRQALRAATAATLVKVVAWSGHICNLRQASRAAALGAVGIGAVFVALALMRRILSLLTDLTK
jgi:hypothetical protein